MYTHNCDSIFRARGSKIPFATSIQDQLFKMCYGQTKAKRIRLAYCVVYEHCRHAKREHSFDIPAPFSSFICVQKHMFSNMRKFCEQLFFYTAKYW